MNLYLVVSEWLYDLYTGNEHRVCELVVARSYSRAKWAALRHDDAKRVTIYDIRKSDIRFAVRLKLKGVPGPARIASDEYDDDRLWDLVTPAPHIGIAA